MLAKQKWCPEPESNRHGSLNFQGLLSPLRLPISPSGHTFKMEAGAGIEPAYTALQAAA